MTPNARHYKTALLTKWGSQISHIGVTNCRKISGSSTWSQHAWSNALDIHCGPNAGDIIAAALRKDPNCKVVLWRVPSHFDHIHVDFWPTGFSVPPCAGGQLQVRHKDGTIDQDWTPDTPQEDTVQQGDIGQHVEWWQRQLKKLGLYTTGDVDGIFGPKMRTAVVSFQNRPAQRLEPTGVIDLTTGAAIVERIANTEYADKGHKHKDAGAHTHDDLVADIKDTQGDVEYIRTDVADLDQRITDVANTAGADMANHEEGQHRHVHQIGQHVTGGAE